MDNSEKLEELKRILNEKFMPNLNIVVKNIKDTKINETCQFVKDYNIKNGENTFYICENRSCAPPFNNQEELKQKLSNI